MSVESMAIALHHSRASGAAKLILVGIANHDGDGGSWPAMATLAKYGNCNVRNAQKAVDKLVELGEIAKHVQAGGAVDLPHHLRPNRYTFTLKCPAGCDRTSKHRVKPVDNSPAHPLSPATPPVASDTRPPVASDTLTTLRTQTRNNAQRKTHVTYDVSPVVDNCDNCHGEVFIDEPAAYALGLCPKCYRNPRTRYRAEQAVTA